MIKRIWDISLTVADLNRAIQFYETVLGLVKKYEYKDYAGFDCGGVEIGLKTWGQREESRKGEPCIDFLVDDLDAAYQKLKEKDVTFVREPEDALWGGRFAVFKDPDGHELQIVQVNWKKYFEAATK